MALKTMVTLAAGLGLSLAACNGSVTTDPTGSGGDGGNGTTAASTTGATTGSSTGSGGICAGFEDAKSTSTVTVRFHNDTGLPVYLPALCENISYTIQPTAGSDGVTYNFETTCLQTCAELQTEPAYACGACAPRSYLLPAGAVREVTWNGTGLLPNVTMPEACWAQPQGNTCQKIVSAVASDYAIQAFGFNSCGDGCTCDDKGVCNGSAEGLQAYADPVKFAFPTKNVVDVTFGVCAFGCAGGD